MIKGMNHVGISVANLDRSIAFYRDMLGMQVLRRRPFSGEMYEAILGLDAAHGELALLQRDSARIELFQFGHPEPVPGDPNRPVCNHGITHFCLHVDDIAETYARLSALGVRFHCAPVTFGRAMATYARDPDGNVVELLQINDE